MIVFLIFSLHFVYSFTITTAAGNQFGTMNKKSKRYSIEKSRLTQMLWMVIFIPLLKVKTQQCKFCIEYKVKSGNLESISKYKTVEANSEVLQEVHCHLMKCSHNHCLLKSQSLFAWANKERIWFDVYLWVIIQVLTMFTRVNNHCTVQQLEVSLYSALCMM